MMMTQSKMRAKGGPTVCFLDKPKRAFSKKDKEVVCSLVTPE